MADNKVVFKVVAEFDAAIKEWQQLRDKVADTTKEYQDAQKEIDKLKKAKGEFTGVAYKSKEAISQEKEALKKSNEEYRNKQKELKATQAAQQKFNNSVGGSSVLSFKNSINAIQKERNSLIELKNTLDITGDEFTIVSNKISILDQKLKTASKGMSGSLGGLNKKLDGTSQKTGAATSSAMELSRVISDAPYGIRGMANNITQLVSQLGFQAAATDKVTGKSVGYLGAIKGMFSALTGPLGIVFAITAVVSAFDFLYGANEKAEDSIKKTTSALEAQRIALEELLEVQNSQGERQNYWQKLRARTTLELTKQTSQLSVMIRALRLQTNTEEERADALEKIIKLYPKYFKSVDVNDLEAITEAEEATNKELIRKEKYTKILIKIQELEGDKIIKKEKQKQVLEKLTTKQTLTGLKDKKRLTNELLGLENEIFELRESAAFLLTQGIDPTEKDEDKKGRKIKLLSIDDFDKQSEDYLSQIASVEEKEELLLAKLNSDKVMIQEKYHLERLDAKHKENQDKFKQQADAYRIEYKAFLDQEVRMGRMTQKDADIQLGIFNDSVKAQQEASQANFNILKQKTKDFYFEKFFLALQGEQKENKVIKEGNDNKLKELTSFIEQYKALMGSIGSFIDGEYERQLTAEQNKTMYKIKN